MFSKRAKLARRLGRRNEKCGLRPRVVSKEQSCPVPSSPSLCPGVETSYSPEKPSKYAANNPIPTTSKGSVNEDVCLGEELCSVPRSLRLTSQRSDGNRQRRGKDKLNYFDLSEEPGFEDHNDHLPSSDEPRSPPAKRPRIKLLEQPLDHDNVQLANVKSKTDTGKLRVMKQSSTAKPENQPSASSLEVLPVAFADTAKHSIVAIDLTMEDDVVKIKEERDVTTGPGLSEGIIDGTTRYITVDRLKKRARMPIPFRHCSSFMSFFDKIIDQMGIPLARTSSINFANVSFKWKTDGNEICLQKGNHFHWTEFCNELQVGWNDSKRSEGEKCRVDIEILMEEQIWD